MSELDFGFSKPHLERVRLLLEPHGFRRPNPTRSEARRGKYRFTCPHSVRSIYVYAPKTPAGGARLMTPDGQMFAWFRKGGPKRYARTPEDLVQQVVSSGL